MELNRYRWIHKKKSTDYFITLKSYLILDLESGSVYWIIKYSLADNSLLYTDTVKG